MLRCSFNWILFNLRCSGTAKLLLQLCWICSLNLKMLFLKTSDRDWEHYRMEASAVLTISMQPWLSQSSCCWGESNKNVPTKTKIIYVVGSVPYLGRMWSCWYLPIVVLLSWKYNHNIVLNGRFLNSMVMEKNEHHKNETNRFSCNKLWFETQKCAREWHTNLNEYALLVTYCNLWWRLNFNNDNL